MASKDPAVQFRIPFKVSACLLDEAMGSGLIAGNDLVPALRLDAFQIDPVAWDIGREHV
jgi:hypothetical protein